ncbi:MAG: Ig-like domain-containing protein, partial [Cohnella sp.]|nr:Ig-like domain-containing protein [Cohnella sp.]
MTTRHRKSFGARAFCALMSMLLAIPLFAAAASAAPGPSAPSNTGPLTWTDYTEPVSQIGINEVFIPYAVAFDDDDNLYVASFSSHTVQEGLGRGRIERISDNGLTVTDITYNAGITYAFSIAADHLGNIYVTDNTTTNTTGSIVNVPSVLERDPVTGMWDDIKNGASIQFPRGIAADRQGNLYVIDSAMNPGVPTTIWKRPSGSPTWDPITGPPEFMSGSYGYDIAVDSAGNIYVGTIGSGGGKIKKLPVGSTTWIDFTPTSLPGFIPFGMAIDTHDNLYVLNLSTGDVLKLGYNGDSGDWAAIVSNPAITDGTLWDVAADSHGFIYSSNVNPFRANVKAMRATVNYNGNGQTSGIAPTDTRAYRPDETATASGAGSMTKTGHMLTGWATSPTATAAEYAPGDSIGMTQTVTLYAVWTPIPVVTLTGIQLDSSEYTLPVDGTHQTVVTAVYSNASTAPLSSGVTFASSNTAVATVDGTGLVTAVAGGQADITASYGGMDATATVTVQAAPPVNVILPPSDPEP